MAALAGVRRTPASGTDTVTGTTADAPPPDTVMLVLPFCTAVTTPRFVTDAIDGLPDRKVTAIPVTRWPAVSTALTESPNVCPRKRATESGETWRVKEVRPLSVALLQPMAVTMAVMMSLRCMVKYAPVGQRRAS